ncbi:hypothetical protein M0811_01547 [Anaeramoeba ignava]|uniref:RING-type domain-containing protein n=1 Tax=Anaeramoeba ignava TaxID=1746090 RepID=A0A9Q0LGQ9_ANAIG|nr:hypothetical protein M0811_01547 [Anaeramoeba ignava]
MENNPFFTSWFLCDLCFEDCFEQISISKLTSCGHILCPKCSSLINDYCPICKTKCTSINFGSNIENLPKSTLDFFQDSTKLIEKFLTIQKKNEKEKEKEKENYNKIKKRIYQSDQWVGKREGNIVRSPHPKTPSLSRKMIKKKNLKQNSLKSPKFFDENLSFLLSPVPSFKKRNIKKKK